jgi:translation initiation factor IF-3
MTCFGKHKHEMERRKKKKKKSMKTKMVTGVVFYSKRDAADYNLQPENEKSLLRFGKDYRLSANFKKPTV